MKLMYIRLSQLQFLVLSSLKRQFIQLKVKLNNVEKI